MAEEQGPIALDVQQQFRTLDPATRELFYGSGIPGTESYRPGFLQQAFQASNRAFFDAEGNPIVAAQQVAGLSPCLLYTSPSPRDGLLSRMPSSA